jgi:uncharacterized repeat protein (TIGR03803 family)
MNRGHAKSALCRLLGAASFGGVLAACASPAQSFGAPGINGPQVSTPGIAGYRPLYARENRRMRFDSGERILWSFGPSYSGGFHPEAGLLSVKGTLYGTTAEGGAYAGSGTGCGTVFAIPESGKVKINVLHSFGSGSDGCEPKGTLINVKGVLYGTTVGGGAYKLGTIFTISPSGKEATFYSFGDVKDGADFPSGGLLYSSGLLYGTSATPQGGTVFAISPSKKQKVLHTFGYGTDGSDPVASVIDVNGTLYGTTEKGGSCGYGTVFAIRLSSATEKVLHSFFCSSEDGGFPYAPLVDVNGTLYGTTYAGGTYNGPSLGGTVFAISPSSGKEKVVYDFSHYPDGKFPEAGLLNVNGTLYGTTTEGGAYYYFGTVFSVTTSGKETILHSFAAPSELDGSYPVAPVIDVNGTLYGTTENGGAHNLGTVFAVSAQ